MPQLEALQCFAVLTVWGPGCLTPGKANYPQQPLGCIRTPSFATLTLFVPILFVKVLIHKTHRVCSCMAGVQ